MEQRYLQYALENPAPPLEDVPDMSADDTIADASAETPGDGTGATVITPDTASAADETDPNVKVTKPGKRQKTAAAPPPDEDVAIVRPRESDDPVVNVLKDMFSIFSDDDEGSSKARRKKKDAVLVLPDTNTSKKKRGSNVKYQKIKPKDR
jgi:hypothetical protein